MQEKPPQTDPITIVEDLRKGEATRMATLAAMLRQGAAKIMTDGERPEWLDAMHLTIADHLEQAAGLLDPERKKTPDPN